MKNAVDILLMGFGAWLALLAGRALLQPQPPQSQEVQRMEAEDSYPRAVDFNQADLDELDLSEPTRLPPQTTKAATADLATELPTVPPADPQLSQIVSPLADEVPNSPAVQNAPPLRPVDPGHAPRATGQSAEPPAKPPATKTTPPDHQGDPGQARAAEPSRKSPPQATPPGPVSDPAATAPLAASLPAHPPLAETPPPDTAPLVYFWHQDLNAAELASREGGRPILMFFTQKDCVPCSLVKQFALKDRRVREHLEREYVLAWVNATNEPLIAEEFGVTTTPRIVLWQPLSPEFKIFTPPSEPVHFLTELRQRRSEYDKELQQ